MCAKLPMAADGIVRLSKIEVYPEYLEEYMKYATEVGEVSLRTEPGVLTMYFQKYKQGTLHMVKTLVLSDQMPLNPANCINNFIQ